MMDEKALIGKIRKLRQIKPRKDWVILTKREILGEERVRVSWIESLRLIFQFKPVLAGVLTIFLFFGIFVSAQNSLPGDLFYPIKKFTEKARAVFVSEVEKPKIDLELTNKRLEEISKIAEQNQVRKLAPAIEEYQKSVAEAVKNLKKESPKITKEIVQETKKIEKNKEKVETLGVVIDDELDNALSQLVKSQIEDFKNRSLTDEQKTMLNQAEADYQAGRYSDALTKIWQLSQLSYPQE